MILLFGTPRVKTPEQNAVLKHVSSARSSAFDNFSIFGFVAPFYRIVGSLHTSLYLSELIIIT